MCARFADVGYSGTTIRRVAGGADVDPALVLHFFGSKDGLFRAALRAETPTDQLVELAHTGSHDDLGERLVRCYLELWEAPKTAGRMLAVVRASGASPSASAMVAEFMSDAVMLPLSQTIGSDQPRLRANLTGAHLLGVATARYVLRVEPLASLDREIVVGYLAPIVQHYLTGELAASQQTGAGISRGESAP